VTALHVACWGEELDVINTLLAVDGMSARVAVCYCLTFNNH